MSRQRWKMKLPDKLVWPCWLVLLGARYCQSRRMISLTRPVHPGTALLDSMGIYAGEPEPAQKADAKASVPGTTVIASPNSATGKQP